jgi:hypothetical protein
MIANNHTKNNIIGRFSFAFTLSIAILFIDACYSGLIYFGYYALQQFRLKMFYLNHWDYSTAGIWDVMNYFNIAYVFALVVILTFSFSFYAAQKSNDQKSDDHTVKPTTVDDKFQDDLLRMIKGYIYFLNTMMLLFSNVTIVSLAMVLDTSLENVFALGIICCLIISNVLINYYYKSLFCFKTKSLAVIQSLACTSVTSVLLVLKLLHVVDTNTVTFSCALLVTSIICFVMQDYVALSKPGSKILNYFKPIQMHSSEPMTQKQNDAFVMIQYYAVWLGFLAVNRGLIIAWHRSLECDDNFYVYVGVILFLLLVGLFMVKKMIHLSFLISHLGVYTYVMPFECLVLAQLYIVPFMASFTAQMYLNFDRENSIVLSFHDLFDQTWDLSCNTLIYNHLLAPSIKEHLFKGVNHVVLAGFAFGVSAGITKAGIDVAMEIQVDTDLKNIHTATEELQKKLPAHSPLVTETNLNMADLRKAQALKLGDYAEKLRISQALNARWSEYLCAQATANQTFCSFEKNETLPSIMNRVFEQETKSGS